MMALFAETILRYSYNAFYIWISLLSTVGWNQ